MRITKTSTQVSASKRRREIANIGCNKCPCCGETMSIAEAIKKGYGLKRGISSISMSRPVSKGLFSNEYKTVDIYSCRKCGAEWESEPYDW